MLTSHIFLFSLHIPKAELLNVSQTKLRILVRTVSMRFSELRSFKQMTIIWIGHCSTLVVRIVNGFARGHVLAPERSTNVC